MLLEKSLNTFPGLLISTVFDGLTTITSPALPGKEVRMKKEDNMRSNSWAIMVKI
jgi:hypothetical protein